MAVHVQGLIVTRPTEVTCDQIYVVTVQNFNFSTVKSIDKLQNFECDQECPVA